MMSGTHDNNNFDFSFALVLDYLLIRFFGNFLPICRLRPFLTLTINPTHNYFLITSNFIITTRFTVCMLIYNLIFKNFAFDSALLK